MFIVRPETIINDAFFPEAEKTGRQELVKVNDVVLSSDPDEATLCVQWAVLSFLKMATKKQKNLNSEWGAGSKESPKRNLGDLISIPSKSLLPIPYSLLQWVWLLAVKYLSHRIFEAPYRHRIEGAFSDEKPHYTS